MIILPIKNRAIMSKTVLIVEDEAIVSRDYRAMLQNTGFKVVGIADNSQKAIELAIQEKPDIILMDINLKGEVSGIETAKIIYDSYRPQIVFLTGFDEEVLVFTGIRYKYIRKPIYEWNLIKVLN
jgi:DNA-binding NarL/FixJ family response regulator